jgi:NADH-quinone oxidoreductase subunit H
MVMLLVLTIILTYAVFVIWAERKVSAFVQDRYGPMVTGPYGLLQTIADLLKLLQKEDIVPKASSTFLFKASPLIIFIVVFIGFSVVPFAPTVIGSRSALGIFFLFAIIAIEVVAIFVVGWSSNNKYSLLGAIRAIAQMISFELPLTLSVLSVLLLSHTLNLDEIVYQQSIWADPMNQENYFLFGITSWGIDLKNYGGVFLWNVFRYPHLLISFIIYFIASLAECNRAPFDIPEGESELVAGFHTEYSGYRFAILFLAEYALMLLVSLLAVILFLGGWTSPLPNIGSVELANYTSGTLGEWTAIAWGGFWMALKTIVLVFLQMMMRWTYPRLRVDQLMRLCWKILLPISIVLVLVSAFWIVWLM